MIRRNILPLYGTAALLMVAALSGCQPASAASEAVRLPAPGKDLPATAGKGYQTAVLAGGCFWGVESVFEHVKGVRKVMAGYSGGAANTAHYDDVSTGNTGHAESVMIEYDPAVISYGKLLQIFFSVALDPTQVNRQGPDSGTQYRSVIFYNTPAQMKVGQDYIAQINAAKIFPRPIATQLTPLKAFYPAEAYHQNYAELHPDNPYIIYNDAPKVAHLQQLFPHTYQPQPPVENRVEVQLQ